MQRALRRLAPFATAAVLVLSLTGSAWAADKYVALGDSYSSGVGANSANLSLSCIRNTYAYPYLVATQRPNTALTFAACSGATTGDVLSSQVNSVTSDTKYVTITIGGNDIGFVNLIISCTTIGCSSAISSSNSKIANQLPAKLDATYAAIKSRAPSAKVVVLGYPRAFGSSGCFAAFGVTSSERTALNALVDNLDNTIKARAQAAGFTYQNPIPAFTGHDVCSSSPFVNALVIVPPTDSYHPTRSGYSSGYAPLVRQVIG